MKNVSFYLIFCTLLINCNNSPLVITKDLGIDTDGEQIIKEEGHLINNKPDGKWKGWYSNNSLAFDIEFNKGQKNGIWKYFYPNGKVQIQFNYINDTLNGIQSTYYKNGQKFSEWHEIMGKRTGKMISYFSNGLISNYRFYDKDGKQQGIFIIFHENGKISQNGVYNNGVIIGRCFNYNDNGIKISITDYDDGSSGKIEYFLNEKGDTIRILK